MTTNKKTRKRQSTYEQKLYAVQEVLEKKRQNQGVADELGIHINSLSLWLRIYREHGAEGLVAKYDKTDVSVHSVEIKRLKEMEKKYKELQVHNEILKKFQAFLKESEKENVSKP